MFNTLAEEKLKQNRAYLNKTLDNISELQYNWNNNCAEPFSKKLVERVRAVANRISFDIDIFPTGRNSIQMEIIENGFYLEIEFFENGKTSEFFMDDEHGIILLDENVIKDSDITDEHINCMFIKG